MTMAARGASDRDSGFGIRDSNPDSAIPNPDSAIPNPDAAIPNRDAGTPNPESRISNPGNEAVDATAEPHTTSVVAWDIPSAIVVGEKFRIKVGIKCSEECDLTSREFRINDHHGACVARGMLPADAWPGTTGLHVAEVELVAPTADGLYTWSVNAANSDGAIPHADASIIIGVRVVCHPDYLVTVETVDRVDQTPLRGARVVMHPYRAVTDERGIAEVRVAKGAYKLFVSQTRYLTFGVPIEVTADMTARAELDVEPVTERN